MTTRHTKATRRRNRQAAAADRDARRAVRRTKQEAANAAARQRLDDRLAEEFAQVFGREPEPAELGWFDELRPETAAEWERMFRTLGYPAAVGRAVHELGYVVFTETADRFTPEEVQAFKDSLGRHTNDS